jgi:hypothetical protein
MNPDFTISKYHQLLEALQKGTYAFQTYADFVRNPSARAVVLRHDVDARPSNALKFGNIQYHHGIAGTYYFRVTPGSWNPNVMKQLHCMGHEIGYHYEDFAWVKNKNAKTSEEIIRNAHTSFVLNLSRMRQVVPVETICSHGSPRSAFDNKALWQSFDYRNEGVIAEPYLDTPFDLVGYFTDTGRSWGGERFSLRDVATGTNRLRFPEIRSTDDLIRGISLNTLPNHLLLTFHPQRWHNSPILWLHEFMWQTLKNRVKLIIKRKRTQK